MSRGKAGRQYENCNSMSLTKDHKENLNIHKSISVCVRVFVCVAVSVNYLISFSIFAIAASLGVSVTFVDMPQRDDKYENEIGLF